MKRVVVPLILLVTLCIGRSAEQSQALDAKKREEIRQELKKLPPEERAAKTREYRRKFGPGFLLDRQEIEKRKEEMKNLSPEERQKKIQEWRQQRTNARRDFKVLSPQEKETKRKEMRERFQTQLEDLRRKKAAGTLSFDEERRLRHYERLAGRFETEGKPGKSKSSSEQ